MRDAHKNFAYSNVATAPSPAASGTSLVVTAGDGAKFPTPPFNATVWPVGLIPITSNAEIVRCTALSTDTLTLTRAQEGSSARTIVAGDQIAATITAKTLTDAEDLIYDGDFASGPTYMDGEIVVYQGVAYLCIKPTTAAPVAWPGGPTIAPPQLPTYGTTLPAAPVDGQEHILVDSATAPSYQWRLRYNAGSTSAYKWEFVGGAPAWGGDSTVIGMTGDAAWHPTGMQFTLVRAGVYDFSFTARGQGGTSTYTMGLSIAGATPTNDVHTSNTNSTWNNVSRDRQRLTVAAGNVVALWYNTSSAQNLDNRTFSCQPVRIS